jgi:stringent starvation protein B
MMGIEVWDKFHVTKTDSNIAKKKCLEQALQSETALVHLDSRFTGMEIPASHRGDPGLTLRLSHHFPGYLQLNEDHVVAQLSFNSIPTRCVLPWDAIWGITPEPGSTELFLDALPLEIMKNMVGLKQNTDSTSESLKEEQEETETISEVPSLKKPTLTRVK